MCAIKPEQVDYQHTAGPVLKKAYTLAGSQITAKMSGITLNKYSAC